jgi:tol-pal system protein YbgF
LRSLADLEQRMAAMQETLDTIRNQVDQVRYKTSGESPDRIPIPVVQGDRTTTVVLEGEQIFLDGQRALQRKDYAGARASYQEFLKQFAHSTRAAEAQLWIGETYYREGKWKEARAAYQVVEQQYLTSPRVPEALMKMALCDEKMGQNAQAAATLQRLIAKFPRWEQVEQAQEMLRSLEKGGPLVPPGPAP